MSSIDMSPGGQMAYIFRPPGVYSAVMNHRFPREKKGKAVL